MKKMRKIFAVLLTLAMVLGMSMTSFAAVNSGTDKILGTADDTATITVNGINNETGISVKAYKVIEATYTGAGNTFNGYTSKYTDVIPQADVTKDLNSLTSDQLKKLAGKITATTNADYTLTETTENPGTWTANVSAGTYLILVTGTEAHSYNPMVVSAYYVNENGVTNINEGTLNLETTSATAKKSDAPNLYKQITNTNGNDFGNSVEVNDIVNYALTVTPIPNYNGSYPVFNVVDTLSTGLEFVKNEGKEVDPVVKVGETPLTKDKDYTVKFEGQKMTVNFVINNAYKLNNSTNNTLTITYSAKVNDKVVSWKNNNTNTAVLNYTTDSKTEGHTKSIDKTTYTYTFDIGGEATGNILVKTGKDNNPNAALGGAEFGLYKATDNDGKTLTTTDIEKAAANTAYKTATSNDTTGNIEFTKLKKGTYYLKETKAPRGYSVNTHVYTIVIDTTHNDDGTLASWTVTIDNNRVATFETNSEATPEFNPVTIVNTTISALPSTGGIGTTIFTIAGCVIMIAAAGLFFASRKKSDNK